MGARAGDEVALSWAAPAGCPSREAVVSEIRRLLGGSIHNPRGVSARAEIEARSAGGYELHLALSAEERERRRDIKASTCEELADTTALITALAIDPNAMTSAPEAPEEQTPPSPALPALSAPPPLPSAPSAPPAPLSSPPPVAAKPPSAPPAPPRLRREIDAHAEIGGEQGAFRRPSLLGLLGAGYARGSLRLEVTGFFAWAGPIAAPEAPTKGGTFWLSGAGIAGCYESPLDGARLGEGAGAACLGVEAGAMGATGYGIRSPSANASAWVAPFAAGVTRVALGPRLALRLDLAVTVPLVRADFTIEGIGVVHRPSVLGVRAGAGLEFRLGFF